MAADHETEDPTDATAPPASNWGPTRPSSVLVLVLVAATVVAFVGAVGLAAPVAFAVLGAALLSVALWAVGRERFRFLACVLANLALVPVGVCLLGAVGGAVLLQYGQVFPVDSPAEIVAPALRIAVEALAVGSVAVAALGAFTSVGDTARVETLRECHSQAFRVAVPPAVAGFGLGLLAVLSSPEFGPTVDPLAALGDAVGVLLRISLSPVPTDLTLGPFLALLGLAALGLSKLVDALPVAEFATAREGSEADQRGTAGPSSERRRSHRERREGSDRASGSVRDASSEADRREGSDRASGRVRHASSEASDANGGAVSREAVAETLVRVAAGAEPAGFLFLVLSLPVSGVAAAVGPLALRAMLGGAGGPLASLTAAPAFRLLLVGFVVLAALVVGVVALLRRSVREATSDLLVGYVPFAVGSGVVVLAFTVHGPVLSAALPAITANLGGFSEPFADLSTGVVEFYGGGVVLSALFGLASLLAVGVVSTLWVVLRLGLVSERAAGPALAATGLLVACGFATAVGASPALVVGGVAAALLVRDVGTYGTTLGAELGRAASTRRTELVHAVGAGLVAVVGVGLATAVAEVAGGTALALPVPVAGPLAAALGALVLLVLVLR